MTEKIQFHFRLSFLVRINSVVKVFIIIICRNPIPLNVISKPLIAGNVTLFLFIFSETFFHSFEIANSYNLYEKN